MTNADVKRKVERGVAWVGVASTVIAVLDLVALAVILRFWVTPAEFGTASVVVTLMAALNLAAELGLPSAIVQGDEPDHAHLSTVYWLGLGSGALFYAAVYLVAPVIAASYRAPELTDLFRTVGLMLLLRPFYTTHMALARRALRFQRLSVLRVIANALEFVAKVGVAALGYGLWCFAVAPLVREAVYAIGFRFIQSFSPRWGFTRGRVGRDMRFGLRSTGGELLFQIYSNLDYQVIGYYFGTAALGVYRAAYELVLEPVRVVSGVVTVVAFPAFARLRSDRDGVITQFIAFVRQNLVVVLVFVAAIVVVAEDALVVFFGPSYAIGAEAARVLAIVGVFRALSHLGPPLLDGLGRADLTLRYQTTAAALLSVGFLTAGTLGETPLAVAAAWAIGYPIAFLVMLSMIMSQTGLRLPTLAQHTWRIVACAVGAGVGGALLHHGLASATPVMRLVLTGVCTVVVGFGAMMLWADFSPRAVARAFKR